MFPIRPRRAASRLSLILFVLFATLASARHSAARLAPAQPAAAMIYPCEPFVPRGAPRNPASRGAESTPIVYVKASNTEQFDNFGAALAVDGDTMVVSSWDEDSAATGVDGDQANNGATEAGAAYVYVRTNGLWTQQAYLKASNTEEYDYFGSSVDIDGDTIVVGARLEDSASRANQQDNSITGAGAAYVYVRTNGVWTQQAYLKASNPGEWDDFGRSVTIDGDTIVVGAWQEDSAATGVGGDQLSNAAVQAGAAYVFVRNNGVWSQQAYLKASNAEAEDRFGASLTLSGNTLVVAAPAEGSAARGVNGNQLDNNAIAAGAAYVFVRNNGVWSQQAYLKASNTDDRDAFGTDVAIDGDTLVVGASSEESRATGVNGNQADNGMPYSGAAYVFVRTNGAWSQQAYLKASNTQQVIPPNGPYPYRFGDVFGLAVAVSGDRIVVGAVEEDGGSAGISAPIDEEVIPSSGAIYVFNRHGTVWSNPTMVKASNPSPQGHFGMAVGLSGELVMASAFCEWSGATGIDGDQADTSAPGSGAAYVIHVPEYRIHMPRIQFK